MRVPARTASALALIVVGLGACDGADRRDAETIVSAVGRFRTADLDATPAVVDALKNTPCRAADVCAAKQACVVAGEALTRSLQLKAEVAAAIAKVESGALSKEAPEAQSLSSKLDEAEAQLKASHDALPACDDQVRALKRKHRL
jgi:hypothetical protein